MHQSGDGQSWITFYANQLNSNLSRHRVGDRQMIAEWLITTDYYFLFVFVNRGSNPQHTSNESTTPRLRFLPNAADLPWVTMNSAIV